MDDYTRVAEHIEKAQGFGVSGMWDAVERMKALGPALLGVENEVAFYARSRFWRLAQETGED